MPRLSSPPTIEEAPANGAGGSLVATNTPSALWRFIVEPSPAEWDSAVRAAAAHLPAEVRGAGDDIDSLLRRSLGEEQFGDRHWEITSALRLYYTLKPALPRATTRIIRRLHSRAEGRFLLGWPIEDRYVRFQWAAAREVIRQRGHTLLPFINFWPDGHPYAFVLTHDVETNEGCGRVRWLADLDARYGFRSSFNFVPERYGVDRGLLDELLGRGFEVGVHGLKHDGRLFTSLPEFMRRAQRINRYLREFGATGFRAPLTHRNPGWMQALEIDYDLSFFDTDPYEPIPGGTMSIWPFMIGRFVELPYTLVQDYTLTRVLRETTPQMWLRKVDFIRGFNGMALLNAHPDYMGDSTTRRVYECFLAAMRGRADFWHALPREVARWWRARSDDRSASGPARAVEATAELITPAGLKIAI
jgi:peptidoglycan/xylan/chitin deacetylase (PgdA/CDA1 family)